MDKCQAVRGIFWIVDNGAKWKDQPREFGGGVAPSELRATECRSQSGSRCCGVTGGGVAPNGP